MKMFENLYIITLIIACMLLGCASRDCPDRDKKRMEGKIVDGRYVSITKFPYTAVLKIGCGEKEATQNHLRTQTRTGTILNQNFVLTAAIVLKPCAYYFGFIGIGVGTEHEMKISHIAESFKIHSDFNENSYENDIALVKSRSPFTFSDRVKRAIVMREPPFNLYKIAYLAGWGASGYKDNFPTHQFLKATTAEFRKTEDCVKLWSDTNPRSQLCLRSPTNISESCDDEDLIGFPGSMVYDSGYGIVLNRTILVGIYSRSRAHLPDKQTINSRTFTVTNVAYYYDWIKNAMDFLHCTLE